MLDNNTYEPKIVAFCCNWCSYAGADGAGTARKIYPANVKIIKVPCSCRVNPCSSCGPSLAAPMVLSFAAAIPAIAITQRAIISPGAA